MWTCNFSWFCVLDVHAGWLITKWNGQQQRRPRQPGGILQRCKAWVLIACPWCHLAIFSLWLPNMLHVLLTRRSFTPLSSHKNLQTPFSLFSFSIYFINFIRAGLGFLDVLISGKPKPAQGNGAGKSLTNYSSMCFWFFLLWGFEFFFVPGD